MMHRVLISMLIAFAAIAAKAQDFMHVHQRVNDTPWRLSLQIDSIDSIRVSSNREQLKVVMHDGFEVPLAIAVTDSISFETLLESGEKDKYQVFQLQVFTQDGSAITSKDFYTPCYVGLNGCDSYASRWTRGGIRGRGNSTWEWYPKKPYRIKFDSKQKMLGLSKAKSWVLLANYRDITDMMNTYVFELGRMMGLPYTNHTRYVELLLNGEYMGLYQLTEQVQQGSSRVNVSDDKGILLTLDVDDGPNNDPSSGRNFWSSVYAMPAAVKYPDEEMLTKASRDSIREVFAQLETAIQRKDYAAASSLLDMESFVRYLMIQELVYNVELSAPRSIFLHKDGEGKWVMGPLWDFDAGYDFDWSDMYTGHHFFADYRETVMGSNPVKRNGNYPAVPQFFTDLFGCKEFVELYKATWSQYADSIVSRPWQEVKSYVNGIRQGAMARDAAKWPISKYRFESELSKMHNWLLNRADYLGQLIENIPIPSETIPVTDEELMGTIDVNVTMKWYNGYSQDVQIPVSRSQVLSLLDVSETDFNGANVDIVPLNTDGSVGGNNTNGVFGGWFNADGNPRYFNEGHVYIEVFSDLFNWNCGLRQDNCYDDAHMVTMQYQYQVGSTLRKVNVRVHFTIDWY